MRLEKRDLVRGRPKMEFSSQSQLTEPFLCICRHCGENTASLGDLVQVPKGDPYRHAKAWEKEARGRRRGGAEDG